MKSYERFKDGDLAEMIIISHNGNFYSVWKNIMIILYIISSFFYAAEAAFRGRHHTQL